MDEPDSVKKTSRHSAGSIGMIIGAIVLAAGAVILPVQFRLTYTGNVSNVAVAYVQSTQYGYGFLLAIVGIVIMLISGLSMRTESAR